VGKLEVLLCSLVNFLDHFSSAHIELFFSIHVCLLWDRALIPQVVIATFWSLARSYTRPFLLVMSNYWWAYRTIPLISKVFRDVQVLDCTDNFKFRGGKGAGDRLIMALVGTPVLEELAALPPLDESSVSVIDVLENRFDTHEKQRTEIERIRQQCDISTIRPRKMPDYYDP